MRGRSKLEGEEMEADKIRKGGQFAGRHTLAYFGKEANV